MSTSCTRRKVAKNHFCGSRWTITALLCSIFYVLCSLSRAHPSNGMQAKSSKKMCGVHTKQEKRVDISVEIVKVSQGFVQHHALRLIINCQ